MNSPYVLLLEMGFSGDRVRAFVDGHCVSEVADVTTNMSVGLNGMAGRIELQAAAGARLKLELPERRITGTHQLSERRVLGCSVRGTSIVWSERDVEPVMF